MMRFGVNSWTQTSPTAPSIDFPTAKRAKPRSGVIRAGLATGLVAFALITGFARPAETAAYKSDSLVCTTLEAGFNYAGDMYVAAQRAGDTKSMNYWIKISSALQGTYLDLNCSYGYYEGPAA